MGRGFSETDRTGILSLLLRFQSFSSANDTNNKTSLSLLRTLVNLFAPLFRLLDRSLYTLIKQDSMPYLNPPPLQQNRPHGEWCLTTTSAFDLYILLSGFDKHIAELGVCVCVCICAFVLDIRVRLPLFK